MVNLKGIFTALVTPFDKGRLDEGSLVRLLEHQLEYGVQGFVVSGTTGESPTLSTEEKLELFSMVKKQVAGRVPLVMGTGTNSTEETIRLTEKAAQSGADAALVVVPYYNKPPQRGLIEHYQKIANASSIPILLYNVPSRTVAGLTLDSIEQLSKHPRIIGIKEATGDMEFARQIREKTQKEFLLTSGDDETWLRLLALGGGGVISVLSHVIPGPMRILAQQIQTGDLNAHEQFEDYKELVKLLFIEANPIPVKYALYLMGLLSSPELRLPLVTLGSAHQEALKKEMMRLEVLS